jgi:hypothetical protein
MIGPIIPYTIASEVGATELCSMTIALGRNVYYILSIVSSGISVDVIQQLPSPVQTNSLSLC